MLKPAKDSIDLCIVVSDIRKSLDFYQGTLGLQKTLEVPTPYGTVHRLSFGRSLLKVMDITLSRLLPKLSRWTVP